MNAARQKSRCPWVGDTDVYRAYHDDEWGVPVHDEAQLFECLTLESAQAGLSWSTILNKREGYREAFHGFDIERVARFTKRDVTRLMKNEAIVRNRLKIEATVNNARAIRTLYDDGETLDGFFWGYVDGRPIQNAPADLDAYPDKTALSKGVARDLKKRGFRFVGPTTVYAFMQAVGLVNDHSKKCYRRAPVSRLR